jgi:predicted nucleic acid-binding protein
MAAGQKKSLALDANVLIDLAEERDFAHEFREAFASRGYSFLIPPTVIAELDFLASVGSDPQRRLADISLEKITSWGCRPFTLSSTDLAIANRFALRLLDLQLIPEAEANDGKILAQASLAGIPLLATSDKHLLDISEDALLLAFNEADLPPVHPAHPKRLMRAMR